MAKAERSEEPRRDSEEELEKLSKSIRRFEIDARRFLAGDLPLPPHDQSDAIQREIRRLRNGRVKGVADSFRLGTLEARYNSYSERFGRLLRERERSSVQSAAPAPKRRDEEVLFGDPKSNPQAAELLYQNLYRHSAGKSGTVDLERFRVYLDRQAATIRAKTGCTQIRFRVVDENGKMKLKARPVREPASAGRTGKDNAPLSAKP